MAALPVIYYRIDRGDGYTLPVVTLPDRRAAAQPNLQWVCQRHLEIVLYNRTDGGYSGAVWCALSSRSHSRTYLSPSLPSPLLPFPSLSET